MEGGLEGFQFGIASLWVRDDLNFRRESTSVKPDTRSPAYYKAMKERNVKRREQYEDGGRTCERNACAPVGNPYVFMFIDSYIGEMAVYVFEKKNLIDY